MDSDRSRDSAIAYIDRAGDAYRSAHRRFLAWLGGIGYCILCFVDPLLAATDPELHHSLAELGLWFIVWLNERGAFFAGIICAIAAADAFAKRRSAWREFSSACDVAVKSSSNDR
jgi:hypothetical protein